MLKFKNKALSVISSFYIQSWIIFLCYCQIVLIFRFYQEQQRCLHDKHVSVFVLTPALSGPVWLSSA